MTGLDRPVVSPVAGIAPVILPALAVAVILAAASAQVAPGAAELPPWSVILERSGADRRRWSVPGYSPGSNPAPWPVVALAVTVSSGR